MILLLACFAAFMLFGVPVAYSMLAASVIYVITNGMSLLQVVITTTSAIGESFTIIAIPFFILAGNIMNNGGITRKIFHFADVCVGWITGGLGHVNILSSVIFSGMSGAAVADAGGLGAI